MKPLLLALSLLVLPFAAQASIFKSPECEYKFYEKQESKRVIVCWKGQDSVTLRYVNALIEQGDELATCLKDQRLAGDAIIVAGETTFHTSHGTKKPFKLKADGRQTSLHDQIVEIASTDSGYSKPVVSVSGTTPESQKVSIKAQIWNAGSIKIDGQPEVKFDSCIPAAP